eukprot:44161-Eustigmatos_ZCMA.PRE.1
MTPGNQGMITRSVTGASSPPARQPGPQGTLPPPIPAANNQAPLQQARERGSGPSSRRRSKRRRSK